MVSEEFGRLLEERRGGEVRGSDQGYIEAEWRIKYVSEKDLPQDPPYVTEYRANFGRSNGGPANGEWFEEFEEFDNDGLRVFSDEWFAAHGWGVITNSLEVRAFIDSRPGLSENIVYYMRKEGAQHG